MPWISSCAPAPHGARWLAIQREILLGTEGCACADRTFVVKSTVEEHGGGARVRSRHRSPPVRIAVLLPPALEAWTPLITREHCGLAAMPSASVRISVASNAGTG